jgi:hypothetical protein
VGPVRRIAGTGGAVRPIMESKSVITVTGRHISRPVCDFTQSS